MLSVFKSNRLFLIAMLFLTQSLVAKVVYISWMEQFGFYPVSNQLVSLNLDTGNIIKQVRYEDSYFSSIKINNSGTDLYVADTSLRRIIQVDSKSLAIKHQWDNLPSKPETLVFNEANNHIYYANTGYAGTGQDNVYQINLISNEVSIANLPVNGLDVRAILMSKDKSVIYIKTYDYINSETTHHSFNATNMQLIASASVGRLFKPVFDNDGQHYYGINTQNSTLEAYRLTNGDLLWSTPISLPVYFLLDVDSNSLLFINSQNVYRVDKSNGNVAVNNNFSTIESTALIDINKPSIICITGFCNLTANLIINKYLPATHSFENIFESEYYVGAEDYVFGNQILASPKQIPSLSQLGLFVFILLLLITIKKHGYSK